MIKLFLGMLSIVLAALVGYFLGVEILVGVIGIFTSTIGGYLFGIGALGEDKLIKFELKVKELNTLSYRFLPVHERLKLLLRMYLLIIISLLFISAIADLFYHKGILGYSSLWIIIGFYSSAVAVYLVSFILITKRRHPPRYPRWFNDLYIIIATPVYLILTLLYLFVDYFAKCSLKILNRLKDEYKSKYTAPALGATLFFLGAIIWIVSLFLK